MQIIAVKNVIRKTTFLIFSLQTKAGLQPHLLRVSA
jgi:hypothetical protein